MTKEEGRHLTDDHLVNCETKPLLNDCAELSKSHSDVSASSFSSQLYTRRWYLQFLVAAVGFLQGLGYNIWGPITRSALQAFHWSNADIAMMPNWANIAYVISQIPASWLLDKKGLRWTFVIASGILVLSSGLRCLPFHPLSQLHKWSVFFGQICCGVAYIFHGGATALFSSTWFPPNQRALSTAVTSTAGVLGGAFAFIIGPLMVSENNSTSSNNTFFNLYEDGNSSGSFVEKERQEIATYMYTQLISSVVFFILALIYFPARPPSAPSMSAQTAREDFLAGFKGMLKNPAFWLLALAFVAVAWSFCWVALLDIDMSGDHVSQIDIGFIGFWSQVAGVIAAVAMGWLSSICSGHLKICITVSMVLSAGFFTLFLLLNHGVLHFSMVLLYISTVGTNIFAGIALPLFYELCCECVFPISESITSSILSIVNNVGGAVFFLIFLIPNVGTAWIDWCVLGSQVLGILCLLVVRVKYRRTQVDTRVNLLPDQETTDVT